MNKEPFVVLMAEDDEHDIVAFRLVSCPRSNF